MMRRSGIPLKKLLRRFCRRSFSASSKFLSANASDTLSDDISRIRNIGILAHIDAGKTTTTERMLFYSGKIRIMGEVHQGNTVTDYMEQERNRGITITSAAATFYWLKHRINLIDTPGHIDFTMEVEQALHVMDGAVVVLDSSAGVEAQTLTVWRQADRCGIPKIVYANKMDRADGDLNLCISTLISKLGAYPLPLQIPLRDNEGKLIGVLDVIRKEKCLWKGSRGEKCERIPLVESDGKLWEEVMTARANLADKLTDIDDNLADTVISLDSLDRLEDKHLENAVHRVTVSQKAVPVVCGSSYKNIGVQLLMDSIVKYLPSPLECSHHKLLNSCFKENLSSKVFKIIHDKQRGPVTFLRIYSGNLTKGQKVYSLQQKKSEQINKLMVALADDYEEVKELGAGNIAAVTGLKNVVTGDLLSSSSSAINSAREYLMKERKLTEEEADNLLCGVNVPDPVFFCSIEPGSLKFQVPLEAALKELQREDPSLRVVFDSETGQTVLGGMGELHIEIIKQRIESDYKVEVDLGPLQIAYKEQLCSPAKYTHELKHTIGNSRHSVKITLSGSILDDANPTNKREILSLDKSPDSVANVSVVTPRQLMLIRQGITSGLMHGPTLGSPVIDITFKLHWLEVGRGTSESMLIAAASQCVRQILSESGTVLMEPVMSLEVVTNADSFSAVMSDLGRRRAAIENVGMRGNNKLVLALVPLSELLGYSKHLRIITSGVGSFTMEFCKYQLVNQEVQEKIVQQTTGV